jgi:hypothetical protein
MCCPAMKRRSNSMDGLGPVIMIIGTGVVIGYFKRASSFTVQLPWVVGMTALITLMYIVYGMSTGAGDPMFILALLIMGGAACFVLISLGVGISRVAMFIASKLGITNV